MKSHLDTEELNKNGVHRRREGEGPDNGEVRREQQVHYSLVDKLGHNFVVPRSQRRQHQTSDTTTTQQEATRGGQSEPQAKGPKLGALQAAAAETEVMVAVVAWYWGGGEREVRPSRAGCLSPVSESLSTMDAGYV